MAKSQRSKVKRSFRRDKRERENSAYHAIDAARLERLSAKLRSKFADTPPDEQEMMERDESDAAAGWLEFALFGLLDQDSLGFTSCERYHCQNFV